MPFLIVLMFFLGSFFPLQESHGRIVDGHDPITKAYNRLVSCGEINNVTYGLRMWTTQEIAQQTRAIDPLNPQGWCDADTILSLTATLKNHLQEFHRDETKKVHVKPIDKASLGYHFLGGGHATYVNNSRGQIRAGINSFREFQQGRNLGVGHQFSFSTEHELNTKSFSLFLKPRFDALMTKKLSGMDAYDVFPEQGYGMLNAGPIRVLAGHAPLVWGEGEYGGLLFTENSRPIEQLHITNPTPFRLPWIFSRLGKWKFATFFATQGPEANFPWSFLAGLGIAYFPINDLQFQLFHTFQGGGKHSPPLGLWTGIREYFGFIPRFSQTSLGGTNKLSAASLRYRFHRAWGTQLYLEYGVDDTNFSSSFRALEKHLKQNSLYKGGLWFSCLFNSCHDAARFEITVNDPIAYRHGQFTDGWTLNGFIMGDALGPDGAKAHLSYEHEWLENLNTRLDFNVLQRQSHSYAIGADGITVTITNYGPREKRYNFLLRQQFSLKSYLVDIGLGCEFIQNLNFINGNKDSVYFLSLATSREF